MATTLGGVTLPEPIAGTEGHRITVVDVGGSQEMADGSLRVHYVGTRKRFVLRFRGLTSTQRDTCYTRYGVKTVQVYSPPESAGTYNVVVVPDSWEESSERTASGFLYDVGFAVEEQAAS